MQRERDREKRYDGWKKDDHLIARNRDDQFKAQRIRVAWMMDETMRRCTGQRISLVRLAAAGCKYVHSMACRRTPSTIAGWPLCRISSSAPHFVTLIAAHVDRMEAHLRRPANCRVA
jgi:hypothetical protein